MSARPDVSRPDAGLLTIDQLAATAGLTVRTTRYYASLGLIPPPGRQGRIAVYDEVHVAHLELVRALQDHGFTLQAVERFFTGLPEDARVEDLALQRAMLTSWTPQPPERLDRHQLEDQVGRRLGDHDVELLVRLGCLERADDGFVAAPSLHVGIELLDVDIPEDSMGAAGEAIRRHMESLAEELTTILRTQVLQPILRGGHPPEDARRFEATMDKLRRLTLEAVVTGFQRAANDVITRSLAR